MTILSENDKRKKQGLIKIHDDINYVDVTSDGELKVKDSFDGKSINFGSISQIATEDRMVISLLNKVLKELKIMNLHLLKMTDENIKYNDIGV